MTYELLTPTQVAENIGVHERTITRWLREGYLRGFKLGKEWRVASQDLDAFLQKQANKPMEMPSHR